LKTQKRIAAEVLGIGVTRVWVNPSAAADISQAMTRDDVRELIKQGLIQEKPKTVPSRKTAKKRAVMKKKRKGISHGKRKGGMSSRETKKERWMKKVRAQRKFLRKLKEEKKITESVYRSYYLQVKGGRFESVKNLNDFMKTDGVLK